MSLDADVGHASPAGISGSSGINKDFVGASHQGRGKHARGLIAAIADGVSLGGRGREAARSTVMGLLADFPCAPPTCDMTVALDGVISAHVVRVLGFDSAGLADDTVCLDTLPALKRLANGDVVDGFVITMAVADTCVHRLYQALCLLLASAVRFMCSAAATRRLPIKTDRSPSFAIATPIQPAALVRRSDDG